MKPLRIVGSSAFILLVVMVAVLAERGDAWSCGDFLYAHRDPVSGHPARDAALSAGVNQLAAMGLSEGQVSAARHAVLRRDGDDRYEEGGKLFLDDVLVAQFQVDRLDDGSFVVGNWKTCAPPA